MGRLNVDSQFAFGSRHYFVHINMNETDCVNMIKLTLEMPTITFMALLQEHIYALNLWHCIQ